MLEAVYVLVHGGRREGGWEGGREGEREGGREGGRQASGTIQCPKIALYQNYLMHS